MLRKSVASKFDLLIVLSVIISVAISSVSITIFLLDRYTEDVIEKDQLHMKGLAGSVKGFIPLSKTWSSGPGQSYLALPWDNSNSGFRFQVS
ncbi:hypothetical protein D1AOALGA4SA_6072, partial [Olavius algarvensis Delta 1 endosymbiont]